MILIDESLSEKKIIFSGNRILLFTRCSILKIIFSGNGRGKCETGCTTLDMPERLAGTNSKNKSVQPAWSRHNLIVCN